MVGRFFEGSVVQAVQLSKGESKGLVVFLTDGSNTANQVETWLLQDAAIQDHLKGLQAILLRLPDNLEQDDATTQDARNFRQLYPTSSLPTVTVVGLQGATLGTITSFESPSALAAALATARGAYQKQILSMQLLTAMMNQSTADAAPPATSVPPTAAAAVTSTTATNMQSTTTTAVRAPSASTVVSDTPLVPSAAPTPAVPTPTPAVPTPDVVPPAQPTVRSTQPAPPKPRTTPKTAPAASRPSRSQASSPPPAPAVAPHTQLQFKQTDGSMLRHTFSSTTPLSEVYTWLNHNRTDGPTPFILLMPYPRRVLSDSDAHSSLLQLELTPRSTLHMNPTSASHSSTAPVFAAYTGGGSNLMIMASSLLGSMLSMMASLWGIVVGLLPWRGGGGMTPRSSAGGIGTTGAAQSTGAANHPARTAHNTQQVRQRRVMGIADIRNDQDEAMDDTGRRGNAFWNGNSTQFGGGGVPPDDAQQ